MDEDIQVVPTRIRMPIGAILAYSILTILSLIAIGGLHTFAKSIAPDYTIPPYPSAVHESIGFCVHLLFLAWLIYHPVRIWKRSPVAVNACLWTTAISSTLTIGTTTYALMPSALKVYGTIFGLTIITVTYIHKSKKIKRWVEYKDSICKQCADAKENKPTKHPLVPASSKPDTATPDIIEGHPSIQVQREHIQASKKPNIIVRAWNWMMQPQLSYPIFILALAIIIYFGFHCELYTATRHGRSFWQYHPDVLLWRIVGSILLLISLISLGKKRTTQDTSSCKEK